MASFNSPVGRIDITEAFEDCINRLYAGATLDECLRLYPHYAPLLRPMLETALSVHQAVPPVPVGAKARVRARVMQAAAVSAPSKRRAVVIPWRMRATLAAAAMILAVLAGFVLLRPNDNQGGGGINTVPLPTESVTVTITASASATPTASLTSTTTASITTTITPSPTLTATDTLTTIFTTTVGVCTLRVTSSSINLRSGPGTGYNVVTYGYAGDEYTVLARHTTGEWLEVQAKTERAWAATLVGTLSGACDALPISTMPYREAPAAPPATLPPGGSGSTPSSGNDNGGEDNSNDNGDDDNSGDNDDDNENENEGD
jgi:uncharacterized protein YraI